MIASQIIGGREKIVLASGYLSRIYLGIHITVCQAEFQMESKDLNVESRDINVLEEKWKNSQNFGVGKVFLTMTKTKQNKNYCKQSQ